MQAVGLLERRRFHRLPRLRVLAFYVLPEDTIIIGAFTAMHFNFWLAFLWRASPHVVLYSILDSR